MMMEIGARRIHFYTARAHQEVEYAGVAIGLEHRDLEPEHRQLAPSHIVDHRLQAHVMAAIGAGESWKKWAFLNHPIALEQGEAHLEKLRALRRKTFAVAPVEHHQGDEPHQRDRIGQHASLSSRPASARAS